MFYNSIFLFRFIIIYISFIYNYMFIPLQACICPYFHQKMSHHINHKKLSLSIFLHLYSHFPLVATIVFTKYLSVGNDFFRTTIPHIRVKVSSICPLLPYFKQHVVLQINPLSSTGQQFFLYKCRITYWIKQCINTPQNILSSIGRHFGWFHALTILFTYFVNICGQLSFPTSVVKSFCNIQSLI